MRRVLYTVTIHCVQDQERSHIQLAEESCIVALRDLFFKGHAADSDAIQFDLSVKSFYQLGVVDFDAEVDVVVRTAPSGVPASPELRELISLRQGEAFHIRALVNTTAVRFLIDGSQVEALTDVRALLE